MSGPIILPCLDCVVGPIVADLRKGRRGFCLSDLGVSCPAVRVPFRIWSVRRGLVSPLLSEMGKAARESGGKTEKHSSGEKQGFGFCLGQDCAAVLCGHPPDLNRCSSLGLFLSVIPLIMGC